MAFISSSFITATIARANALCDHEPPLRDDSSRKVLISWLCWADCNGAWTDADSEAEGLDPMTREEAIKQIALMLTD